jgi:hypothetical protein
VRKSDIFEVAIKILGLYFLVTVIGTLRDILTYVAFDIQAKQDSDPSQQFTLVPFFVASFVIFILMISFAFLLIFKTKAVVKRVCSPSDFEETAQLFTEKKVVYEMALIITGLLLIVWTLPEFAFRLMDYILLIRGGAHAKSYDTNFLIIAALKILVGFFSIAKAKSLSLFFAKEKENLHGE